ncbi:PAP2 superfamily protein [Gracilaria domingensis]|nr:PAP2 superfamily protein [Gracilaria domingensis]
MASSISVILIASVLVAFVNAATLDTTVRQTSCVSITDCPTGLVCVGTNPGGVCAKADGILGLSHLVVNLIQLDYTPPPGETDPSPVQAGPTVTARAMAIIYMAAHDAFAIVSGAFEPKLTGTFGASASAAASSAFGSSGIAETQAEFAMQAAGLTAAKLLYPPSASIIDDVLDDVTEGAAPGVVLFGERLGTIWFNSRLTDGSQIPQLDEIFEFDVFLKHQPDPNFPIVVNDPDAVQKNFGRFWGDVTPFVISDVETDAFLEIFPPFDSPAYREDLAEVEELGQCNDITLDDGTPIEDIGIFWGYDGAAFIGVPPRLYLQTLLAVKELEDLPLASQIRALAGANVAMGDAGIAAWFWKFFYDLWRPTLGVRLDPISPNATWNPRGVPQSNVITDPPPPFCVGVNPDFPAYPSGHSTFGTAAFATISKILGKDPSEITVTITSDEFNGITLEGTSETGTPGGVVRPIFTQTITLAEAITQNKDSRVFLGVHWRFDSEGGEVVGDQIAEIAAREFSI